MESWSLIKKGWCGSAHSPSAPTGINNSRDFPLQLSISKPPFTVTHLCPNKTAVQNFTTWPLADYNSCWSASLLICYCHKQAIMSFPHLSRWWKKTGRVRLKMSSAKTLSISSTAARTLTLVRVRPEAKSLVDAATTVNMHLLTHKKEKHK